MYTYSEGKRAYQVTKIKQPFMNGCSPSSQSFKSRALTSGRRIVLKGCLASSVGEMDCKRLEFVEGYSRNQKVGTWLSCNPKPKTDAKPAQIFLESTGGQGTFRPV